MWGFGEALIAPVWMARLSEERHSVALLSESYSEMPCRENLKIRYSRDLKTRRNHDPRSLGMSCHNVWVGVGHKR
jgi:hypothetical protein